jgi:hypothetical protein
MENPERKGRVTNSAHTVRDLCAPAADGMSVVDGTVQVSQQCILIEHERTVNECTDRFEDSHTHTNECVDFSCSPGVSTLTSTEL